MNGYGFSRDVREALARARNEAALLNHHYINTEHVLLGIISNPENIGSALLKLRKVSPAQVRDRIESIMKVGLGPARDDLPYTSAAKRILEQAMSQAQELGDAEVNTGHLLLGVIREQKGIGAGVLAEFGFASDETVLELARMTRAGLNEDRPFAPDLVTMGPQRAASMLDAMLRSPRVAAVFARHAIDLSAVIHDLRADPPSP